MSKGHPFIPKNKPKFWIMGIIAGLAGLGFGLLAFVATLFGFPLLMGFFTVGFFACWAMFVVSWFGFVLGMLGGRYHGLTEKPWHEQVW